MDSMDFNELFSLLQSTDETDRIEAKSAAYGLGKSFLETVSAFSNEPDLGGGYVLLGVTKNEEGLDTKYSVMALVDPDKLQNEIASQCRQCFNVSVDPIIRAIARPEGAMLLVYIPEANAHEKPVFIKSKGIDKGAYRRIGPSDQICTREDIDLLYQLRARHKYDESLIEDATIADFDPHAIKLYRFEREKIKADAPELRYNDEGLLKALRGLNTEKGVTLPTIGGILLFGTTMAHRRLFPLRTRVDYILVEGREWITDSDHRYTAMELCEALITGIPRLINQIMIDIPQIFALEDDSIRRKDNPLIPRKVIREAVVNALMHRDYRSTSPIQIIKYANRIEFRNAGYSLKPQEQLGLPGSIPRNTILTQVFNDIQYAEAKGTGIGTMRDEMKKANLSVPLIESDRASNLFVLTLLPHHLFGKEDIEWLSHFKDFNLTNEEARSLIVIREKGSITNAEYRTINGVDTLAASSHLRRLRDLGLLEQKGGGNATFYLPSPKLLAPGICPPAPGICPPAPGICPPAPDVYVKNIPKLPLNFPPLPERLIQELQSIGGKATKQKIKSLIKELCSLGSLTIPELSIILQREGDHLRKRYLSQMIDSQDLEYVHPESPTHPDQAYRTKEPTLP